MSATPLFAQAGVETYPFREPSWLSPSFPTPLFVPTRPLGR